LNVAVFIFVRPECRAALRRGVSRDMPRVARYTASHRDAALAMNGNLIHFGSAHEN
jgi:hypothetical protein